MPPKIPIYIGHGKPKAESLINKTKPDKLNSTKQSLYEDDELDPRSQDLANDVTENEETSGNNDSGKDEKRLKKETPPVETKKGK